MSTHEFVLFYCRTSDERNGDSYLSCNTRYFHNSGINQFGFSNNFFMSCYFFGVGWTSSIFQWGYFFYRFVRKYICTRRPPVYFIIDLIGARVFAPNVPLTVYIQIFNLNCRSLTRIRCMLSQPPLAPDQFGWNHGLLLNALLRGSIIEIYQTLVQRCMENHPCELPGLMRLAQGLIGNSPSLTCFAVNSVWNKSLLYDLFHDTCMYWNWEKARPWNWYS